MNGGIVKNPVLAIPGRHEQTEVIIGVRSDVPALTIRDACKALQGIAPSDAEALADRLERQASAPVYAIRVKQEP